MLSGTPLILWFYKDRLFVLQLFLLLAERAVLLKQQGGPTNTNSQNMFYIFDNPLILHSAYVFVGLTNI